MIQKDLLINLYFKKRFSVPQISNLLKVSESGINYWLRKYKIKKRDISQAVYNSHNPKGDPFKIPRFIKNKAVYSDKNFIYGLGLGLYWGEGNKIDQSSVRLGNTDSKLIIYFIKFLSEIFSIKKEKMKFGLQIFSDIDPQRALSFWQKQLKLSRNQFYKPIITKTGKIGTYRNKSEHGVLTVYFNNTKLKKFIFEEIQKL